MGWKGVRTADLGSRNLSPDPIGRNSNYARAIPVGSGVKPGRGRNSWVVICQQLDMTLDQATSDLAL